jgi:hypothetical protein
MRHFIISLLLVIGVCAVGVVSLAGESINLKNLTGPKDILYGPVYTYSIEVEGSPKDMGCSVNGGKVINIRWEGQRYVCDVQWDGVTEGNETRIKFWGAGENGDQKVERMPVALQAKKRGLDYRSLRSAGGKCLDVNLLDLVKNGGKIQVWECNGEIQQRWKLDNQSRLVNEGGKCLDVDVNELKKDGGKVQVWECNNEIQQKWRFDDKGRLVSGGGKCLDVDAAQLKQDGGKVQVWQCNNEPQQKWKFE